MHHFFIGVCFSESDKDALFYTLVRLLQKEGYIFPTVQNLMNKHKLLCSVHKTHLSVRAEDSEQEELRGNTSPSVLNRATNKPVLS